MWLNKKQNPNPEIDRLMELRGYDWSDFTRKGKFIKYKPGSGKKTGKARFCIYNEKNNTFVTCKDAWVYCNEYRYLGEQK